MQILSKQRGHWPLESREQGAGQVTQRGKEKTAPPAPHTFHHKVQHSGPHFLRLPFTQTIKLTFMTSPDLFFAECTQNPQSEDQFGSPSGWSTPTEPMPSPVLVLDGPVFSHLDPTVGVVGSHYTNKTQHREHNFSNKDGGWETHWNHFPPKQLSPLQTLPEGCVDTSGCHSRTLMQQSTWENGTDQRFL